MGRTPAPVTIPEIAAAVERARGDLTAAAIHVDGGIYDRHRDQDCGAYGASIDGRRVGHVDFAVFRGSACVQWIESTVRRCGVGLALLDRIATDYGAANIVFGLLTPSGARLAESFDRRHGIRRYRVAHDPAAIFARLGGRVIDHRPITTPRDRDERPGQDLDWRSVYVEFGTATDAAASVGRLAEWGVDVAGFDIQDGGEHGAWIELSILAGETRVEIGETYDRPEVLGPLDE